MNRNVVIGGVVAVAILLGVAAWFLLSGRGTSTTGPGTMDEASGPIMLNPVAVVTDHSASQSEDGRTLSISFPKFELAAKGGETTSAVFSTTWRLKMAPEERAVVAIAALRGYMKSAGTPAPTPAPAAQPAAPAPASEPATAAAPAGDATAAPAPATAPPAEQPAATPVPPAPAKPVAGDGVARVIVSIGGEVSVTEWRDWNGEGAEHKLSKAVAFVDAPDLRDGATVPVTVTIEAFGATANETLARLSAIDLRVVPEAAPLPSAPPATTEAPAEVAPPTETTTTTPAEGTTPPADGTTTTPPAEGTPPATPNP